LFNKDKNDLRPSSFGKEQSTPEGGLLLFNPNIRLKLISRKNEPTQDKQTATNGARHQGRFLAAHENATFVLFSYCSVRFLL
jgi:hypothetical protein